MATLIPDSAALTALPTPLTAGEAHLLDFLARDLGPEWEVYAQPYLNGTRPDIVALHPTRGALVLEVKDWNLACYAWGQERWRVRGAGGEGHVTSPFKQVEFCRDSILRYLVPQIGALLRERGWEMLSVVRVGVYFHGAAEAEVRALTAGRVHGAVWQLGRDSLHPGVAEGWTGNGRHVPTEFASLLRAWLRPPAHALEQMAPLHLTPAQERLAVPRAGFKRLRGVAGSGKSLVLSARAARLALAGQKVLMVSFNITLWHLLRDGVRRAGGRAALDNVTFGHFHWLARLLGLQSGLTWSECDNDPAVLLRRAAALLGTTFDAVLVDEAQDMDDSWGEALMDLVCPNGQFVAACDDLQNLYERPCTWIQDGRFGRWRELRGSVRLHDRAVRWANDFAGAYLPGVGLLAESEQPMLPIGAPEFRWHDIPDEQQALKAAVARVQELIGAGTQPTDIAVLLPQHRLGLRLVGLLEAQGFRINHVFTEDQDDKRGKYAFWMGDARIKACTVHSFKGWEARHVVAILADQDQFSPGQRARVAYTAITRAQASLTVLNLSAAFRGFAQQVREVEAA